MTTESSLRKLHRSLLNSLREACVYSSPLTFACGDKSWQLIPTEFQETASRNLDEIKTVNTSELPESVTDGLESFVLLIEQGGDHFKVPVSLKNTGPNANCKWELRISEATAHNRRRGQRQSVQESFYVPVLVYLHQEHHFPVSGFARAIDYEPDSIGFELKLAIEINRSDLVRSKLLFQESSLPFSSKEFLVESVRDFVTDSTPEGALTVAKVITRFDLKHEDPKRISSLIESSKTIGIPLKLFLKDISNYTAYPDSFFVDGFSANFSGTTGQELPRLFIAENIESRTRFNVSNHENRLDFRLASGDLGNRVQWYNFLTREVLHFQHHFSPNDARDVTKLMLDSGNYSRSALSEHVLLHRYLEFKWQIEEAFSKTKYRWLVRGSNGKAIGHTAALRVSEQLWAAIDNIGLQSYSGSWNSEFVTKWLRLFREILSGQNGQSYIQWTYTPTAGVWNTFDRALQENPELLLSRDRLIGCFFANYRIEKPVRRAIYSAEELSHPEEPGSKWVEKLGLSSSKFFHYLTVGTKTASTFTHDFEHDYLTKFCRRYFLIHRETIPDFVLTFSNYPSWASLNKGHDFAYLFPLDGNQSISSNHENELVSLIKETMFKAGCSPYRFAIVGDCISLTSGKAYQNLIIAPDALEYAARTWDTK